MWVKMLEKSGCSFKSKSFFKGEIVPVFCLTVYSAPVYDFFLQPRVKSHLEPQIQRSLKRGTDTERERQSALVK